LVYKSPSNGFCKSAQTALLKPNPIALKELYFEPAINGHQDPLEEEQSYL